jgi:hypothetical protein
MLEQCWALARGCEYTDGDVLLLSDYILSYAAEMTAQR